MVYKTKTDVLKMQRVLVDFGKFLIKYINEIPSRSRDKCFFTLQIILMRKELHLSYLGFEKN